MERGEKVSALSRELNVRHKLLYEWRDAFRAGGPEGLPTGRAGDWDHSQLGMRTNRVILIETRSANSIRASGQAPPQQAGHMTAPDRGGNQANFPLQRRGRSHMTPLFDSEPFVLLGAMLNFFLMK